MILWNALPMCYPVRLVNEHKTIFVYSVVHTTSANDLSKDLSTCGVMYDAIPMTVPSHATYATGRLPVVIISLNMPELIINLGIKRKCSISLIFNLIVLSRSQSDTISSHQGEGECFSHEGETEADLLYLITSLSLDGHTEGSGVIETKSPALPRAITAPPVWVGTIPSLPTEDSRIPPILTTDLSNAFIPTRTTHNLPLLGPHVPNLRLIAEDHSSSSTLDPCKSPVRLHPSLLLHDDKETLQKHAADIYWAINDTDVLWLKVGVVILEILRITKLADLKNLPPAIQCILWLPRATRFCLAKPANVLILASCFLSLMLKIDGGDEGRSCRTSGSAVNGLVYHITRRTANVIYESFASAFKFWPHKERIADCRDSYDGKSTDRRSSPTAKKDVQGELLTLSSSTQRDHWNKC